MYQSITAVWVQSLGCGLENILFLFCACNMGEVFGCVCNEALLMLMQARPDVGPPIIELVVAIVSKADDASAIAAEIGALVKYVEHTFLMREVTKQRKQWEDDRQAKVNDAIARAMKAWDDEHYPHLLLATWGWHPFYTCFVANPLCFDFTPSHPILNGIVEGSDVHAIVLQQTHVTRVYPVPWSVLLIRCFLKFHTPSAAVVSHPSNGSTVSNVTEWSKLAQSADAGGSGAWQLATSYLKQEGLVMFAGSRPVESHEQWVTEVDDATQDLMHPTPEWWAELNMWCNATRFKAIKDMAFHDRQSWLKAWVIRDRPQSVSPPLQCFERWLQHREDLDIGYVLANPGIIDD